MAEWRTLLFILLLSPAIFAINPIGNELQISVGAVAVIVAILLALIQMLANTISDPKLEAWVKTEFRELFVGVIIIVALTTAAVSSHAIAAVLTGDANYITSSTNTINDWISILDDAFTDAIIAGGKIRTASTYSPYMNIPLWYVSLSYSTNPLSGTMLLMTPLTMASQALTNAVFLLEGLKLLIFYSAAISPTILLPGAFIVRLIPFTRKLGNTLIAIAMAAYVFLPFSVILVDKLNETITVPHPSMDTGGLNAASWVMGAATPFCQAEPIRFLLGLGDYPFSLIVCAFLLLIPGGQAAYPSCVFLVQNVVYPLIQIVFQLLFTLFTILWEPIVMEGQEYWLDAFDIVFPFLEQVNGFVLLMYLDLIIIATITMSGARSLSSALGGEIYMYGVQRLI